MPAYKAPTPPKACHNKPLWDMGTCKSEHLHSCKLKEEIIDKISTKLRMLLNCMITARGVALPGYLSR